MASRKAEVVDVLRSMQRDELAIREIEESIQAFSKSLGTRNYRNFSKFIPYISSFWYYYITSCNDLQTLGEEYSNVIRLSDDNLIPSRLTQLFWLTLYIGGEPLLNRLVSYTETQIKSSPELRVEAKQKLLKILDLWHSHKNTLKSVHRSIFYMTGRYFSIAHRLAGIKYILLRDWMEDKTFVRSFRFLGFFSILYSLFDVVNALWNTRHEKVKPQESIVHTRSEHSIKLCVLCNEERRNPSVTPCGHIFCWECIHESFQYQNKCPLCREEVEPSRVVFLQNYI